MNASEIYISVSYWSVEFKSLKDAVEQISSEDYFLDVRGTVISKIVFLSIELSIRHTYLTTHDKVSLYLTRFHDHFQLQFDFRIQKRKLFKRLFICQRVINIFF